MWNLVHDHWRTKSSAERLTDFSPRLPGGRIFHACGDANHRP